MKNNEWKNKYHEITEGVFVYINSGGYCMNNCGMIAGDKQAIVIDSLASIGTTAEFSEKAKVVLKHKKISFFTQTHGHPDHMAGVGVYPEAITIGHSSLKEEYNAMPFEIQKTAIKNFWPEDTTGMIRRDPDIIYTDGTLTVDLGNREVKLMSFSHNHHFSDTVAYIPDSKILFAGDLLYQNEWPDAFCGNIQNWIKTLDIIGNLDVETYIPGHGPMMTKDDLWKFKELLEYIEEITKDGFNKGMHQRDIFKKVDFDKFDNLDIPSRVLKLIDLSYRGMRGQNTRFEFCDWDINKEIAEINKKLGIKEKHFPMFTQEIANMLFDKKKITK